MNGQLIVIDAASPSRVSLKRDSINQSARLDQLIEKSCRRSLRMRDGIALTLVCEAIACDCRMARETDRLAYSILHRFLRHSSVRHVVVGLNIAPCAIELSVWGHGMRFVPTGIWDAVNQFGRGFGASSLYRRSEMGAGVGIVVPLS